MWNAQEAKLIGLCLAAENLPVVAERARKLRELAEMSECRRLNARHKVTHCAWHSDACKRRRSLEPATLEAQDLVAFGEWLDAFYRELKAWALFDLSNSAHGLGRCGACPQCQRKPVEPGPVNWHVVNACRVELARMLLGN